MSNPVIENVRRSLAASGIKPSGLQGQLALTGPRPAIYPARQPGTVEAEIEQFLGEVRKLSGIAERVTVDGIAMAIKNLVEDHQVHKASVWDTPALRKLGVAARLNELGVELVPPENGEAEGSGKHAMAQCDLGITEADYLLPETGTLALHTSAKKSRAVSLLPRIHLAIVRPDMLRADLHEVFAEARNQHYLVFVTGPSRTADIELTVTLGVHGPKTLVVWMLEG